MAFIYYFYCLFIFQLECGTHSVNTNHPVGLQNIYWIWILLFILIYLYTYNLPSFRDKNDRKKMQSLNSVMQLFIVLSFSEVPTVEKRLYLKLGLGQWDVLKDSDTKVGMQIQTEEGPTSIRSAGPSLLLAVSVLTFLSQKTARWTSEYSYDIGQVYCHSVCFSCLKRLIS